MPWAEEEGRDDIVRPLYTADLVARCRQMIAGGLQVGLFERAHHRDTDKQRKTNQPRAFTATDHLQEDTADCRH